jgi:hypothetical protein
MSKWISAKTPPKHNNYVLLAIYYPFCEEYFLFIGYHYGDKWFTDDACKVKNKLFYWQELPKPPKINI